MKRGIVLGATLALLLAPVLGRLLLAQSPSAPPPPPPTYTLTDLGQMTVGAIDSQNVRAGPTALNGTAQVAGFRFNLAFNDQPIGFLWNTGVFTDLGTGGGPQSFAYGINKAGQIVGTSNFVASATFPGDLTGNSSRAFIYQNGVMNILDADPNFWSRAYAINAGGDVAGFIATGGPFPVIWKGGTAAGRTMLQSLPCSLASCQGEAMAINDLGQVAGWSVGGNVNVARPVMWDTNGQPTDLIPNPGFYTEANGINNGGVVIGYYQPAQLSNTPIHAFSWQSGVLTDLGAVGNDTYSGAWGINSKGDIVGIWGTNANPILVGSGGGGRAFLYTGGIMHDLSSLLVSGTNWSLDAAFAINDSGQIVGTGIAPDRTEHGYLLTPLMTPTTTTLAASVNPSVFGQQVSFTATVTPNTPSSNTPTGTVTFSDGATVLGAVTPLNNGVAIFNTSALGVGTHAITASYGGDNQFGSSTSATLIQTVNQAATSTTLMASPNPANFGQAVTFTATVNVVAPGAGSPTGTVTFLDGTTTLGTGALNTSGTATFGTSSLAAGSHSVTASYGGDVNFTGSTTASSVTVTVQAPPPPLQVMVNETITVTDTESFPDVFDAEAVHVSDAVFVTPLINVAAPVAEFSAGSLGFGSVMPGQTGTQSLTLSDIGQAPLTLSSAAITAGAPFAISQIACSNSATSLPTTLPVGGACNFLIAYTAPATGTPSATLTFMDNAALSNLTSTPAGASFTQSIALSGAGSSTAPPPPPPAVIPIMDSETIHVTDVESFPDVFDSEKITVTDQVSVQAFNITTTSISISSRTVFGIPLSGTVSVNSSTAAVTGNVTLTLDGGTAVTLLVSSGSATFNLGSLSVGPHALVANFPAQRNFLGSSAGAKFTVVQATPTISWKNPAPVTFGTPLSSAQLNATASVAGNSVAGTFAYNPPAGTVLGAGSQTLSVTFTPTDTMDYTTATASVTLMANNTPPGTGVPVTPMVVGGGSSPVSLVFTNVAPPGGVTSLSITNTGPAPPTGFQLGNPPVYYNLTTTATFTGNVTICINYTGIAFTQPPRLFHIVGGMPVDITTSVDTTNMIVCGVTTSFSPFALFAPLPQLTITAKNASRQYGQPNPSLNNVTYSGFVNGDGAGSLSGSLVCTTTATPTSPVGPYPITCSGLTSSNYTITFVPGTLTVTPAPLTIAANNASKSYGQTVAFAGTEFMASGLLNSDSVTSVTLTSAGAAAAATVAGSPYAITPSAAVGTGLGNYTIGYTNGTLAVIPAVVTITANNATKVLNAVNPALNWTASGFANGETTSVLTARPVCTTSAATNSPIGSYPLTCSGASAANYTFAYVPGTLKIQYATTIGHVIQPPINADGSSAFNQGRTVPAKFDVYDVNGVAISTPGVVSSFFLTAIVTRTVTTTVENAVDTNNPDTAFRWDGQEWIFNITTANLSAGNTYIYTIALNDGSTIVFEYGLR